MLNRCPSCQASVLDDDAETCPFCGSPMDPAKAKGFQPAAKPAAAAAPAAPKKPAAKPTTAKPAAAKPAAPSAKAAPAEDEDPFATDAAAAAGATPLSRKPTPQRPHKIVCPMCDTPGYAPTAASGKDVRCANPKCLVPVFTAPDFAAPKPAEPEPQSSGIGPTVLTFAAVGLILLGGAVWWFFLREPPLEPSAGGFAVNPPTPVSPDDPAPGETEPAEPVVQTPTPPTPAETLEAVLKRWPNVTEDITQPQRQGLLRRYGAEAYAITGRTDAAREQIEKLRPGSPFYAITPLAELAWAQLSGGDEAAAKATFEQTAPLTDRIPQQGFDPARVVIDWSAAAARFGQEQAARDLSRAPRDDAAGEQLLALLRSASAFNGDDLAAEYPLRPVWPWHEPKTTAATLDLLERGATDQARTWAAGHSDAVVQAEGLAAWAESVAADASRPAEERAAAIGEAVASSDPAGQAFALARAAVRAAAREDQATAEGLLTRAGEAAAQLPAPEPFTAPGMAELYRRDLPDQAMVHLRAAAFGEAAHAAALLGKTDQAAKLLSQALDHLRSAAPSIGAIAERRQEFDRLGRGARDELRSLLNLNSDSQAQNAFNEYRRKLDDVRSAAAARFDLQTELLARAIGWKLGPQVLAIAKERSAADDVDAREPYLSGTAGGRLLAAAEMSGDAETARELRSAGVANRDVPGPQALALTIEPNLKEDKVEAAAREIDSDAWNRLVGRSEKLSLAIRTACRLAKQKSTADAYTFATTLRDDILREETLRYLSACVARGGKGYEAEALLPRLRLVPSDQAAVLRGLTEGLVSAGAKMAGAADGTAATTPAGS